MVEIILFLIAQYVFCFCEGAGVDPSASVDLDSDEMPELGDLDTQMTTYDPIQFGEWPSNLNLSIRSIDEVDPDEVTQSILN